MHVTGFPSSLTLGQLAVFFLSCSETSDSLLYLTVHLNTNSDTREAVAVFSSTTDAINAELELTGLSLYDDGSTALKTRRVCPEQSLPSTAVVGASEGHRPYPVRTHEGYRKVLESSYCPKDSKCDLTDKKVEVSHVPEMSRRLYVANIPKSKSQAEILEYFQRCFPGVTGVILYSYPGSERSRGFCFVEFSSVNCAMIAKEAIVASRPWGCNVVADWADPEYEPDEEVMKNVKVLYLKNIASTTTENDIRKAIEVWVSFILIFRFWCSHWT